MSLVDEFSPLKIEEFLGLMTISDPQDTPPSFATTCDNASFTSGKVSTRPGLDLGTDMGFSLIGGSILHAERFDRLPAGGSLSKWWLLLVSIGGQVNFYSWDQTTLTLLAQSAAAPPANVIRDSGLASAVHFRIAVYFARAFVSFSDGAKGVTTPYIFDPSWAVGSMLVPMGLGVENLAPTLNAADGAAGSVTAGQHLIGVLAETRSGFIFPVFETTGVFAPTAYIAPGGKKINLTGIPVYTNNGGPGGSSPAYYAAHVAKRHIIMTAVGLATYYIAATINDNTSTTLTFDLSDTALQDGTDASVYFTYRSQIPGATVSLMYHDRQVMVGDGSNPTIAIVSEVDQPESFIEATSFQIINLDDGKRLSNLFLQRDTLFYVKETSLWATQDSGSTVDTWNGPYFVADVGTRSPSGVVGNPLNYDDASDDAANWILSDNALYRFDGGLPAKYSNVIRPTWLGIDFSKGEVHFDQRLSRVCCMGTQSGSTIILVLDLTERKKPKWARWTFGFQPTSIIIDTSFSNAYSVFVFGDGGFDGRFARHFSDTAYTDALTSVLSFGIAFEYRAGPQAPRGDGINLFGGYTIFASGNLSLTVKLYDLAGTAQLTQTNPLVTSPASDITRGANVRTERLQMGFSQGQSNGPRLTISRATLYAKPDGERAR